MKKLGRIVAVCVALAAIIVWIHVSRDEYRIRRSMNRLIAATEKKAGEKNFAALNNAQTIADAFDQECFVSLPPYIQGTFKKREFAQLALQYRASVDQLDIRLLEFTIEMGTPRTTAVSQAKVEGRARSGGQTQADVQECKMVWRKVDREWLLTRVELVGASGVRPLGL